MGFRTGIPFFIKNLFRRLAEKTGHCEMVLFLVIFGTRTMSLSLFKAGKKVDRPGSSAPVRDPSKTPQRVMLLSSG